MLSTSRWAITGPIAANKPRVVRERAIDPRRPDLRPTLEPGPALGLLEEGSWPPLERKRVDEYLARRGPGRFATDCGLHRSVGQARIDLPSSSGVSHAFSIHAAIR